MSYQPFMQADVGMASCTSSQALAAATDLPGATWMSLSSCAPASSGGLSNTPATLVCVWGQGRASGSGERRAVVGGVSVSECEREARAGQLMRAGVLQEGSVLHEGGGVSRQQVSEILHVGLGSGR